MSDRRRIDQLLVERGLFESRGKGRAAIEAGGVRVNGRQVLKSAELVNSDAVIEATPAHPWVSRSGLKLDFALSTWPISVTGRVVLDLGASTGGFTQVCLQRGAARVYAVDVGHDQLHAKLRADGRVVDLQGLDARRLDSSWFPEPPSLIVCDASFIGLSKVLKVALSLGTADAELVALVKPQFEVGPAHVGKGGIVRDEYARQGALHAVEAWLESQDWAVRGSAESPIAGQDGNREFLLWAVRRLSPSNQR